MNVGARCAELEDLSLTFRLLKVQNDTATRARCCLVAPIPQCLKQGIRLCLVECASKLTMLYVVGDAKWSTVSPEDNQKT